MIHINDGYITPEEQYQLQTNKNTKSTIITTPQQNSVQQSTQRKTNYGLRILSDVKLAPKSIYENFAANLLGRKSDTIKLTDVLRGCTPINCDKNTENETKAINEIEPNLDKSIASADKEEHILHKNSSKAHQDSCSGQVSVHFLKFKFDLCLFFFSFFFRLQWKSKLMRFPHKEEI